MVSGRVDAGGEDSDEDEADEEGRACWRTAERDEVTPPPALMKDDDDNLMIS